MSRIAYVNGRYVPHRQAMVHVEDRGYQFADGVYEVLAVKDGQPVDETLHLDRLDRSLREIRIAPPFGRTAIATIFKEIVRRNLLSDGVLYLQVSRGVARRDHAFPTGVRPSVVVTGRRPRPPAADAIENGVAVVSKPDIRWGRCDVKSIALLPNALLKQEAREAGAYEAWLTDDKGVVTEGTSSNAWIVDKSGRLVTHPADHAILNGVTRQVVLRLAREQGIDVVERTFTLAEAKAAREAFLTSTTVGILPVVRIDEAPVGNGAPGLLTGELRRTYFGHPAGVVLAVPTGNSRPAN
ncbi:MAG: D-amino-acid transaminase [Rhodospirillaceae bacterium]|nr:D-amino-acid transaminase [Rhodospirillaceae bacterium]